MFRIDISDRREQKPKEREGSDHCKRNPAITIEQLPSQARNPTTKKLYRRICPSIIAAPARQARAAILMNLGFNRTSEPQAVKAQLYSICASNHQRHRKISQMFSNNVWPRYFNHIINNCLDVLFWLRTAFCIHAARAWPAFMASSSTDQVACLLDMYAIRYLIRVIKRSDSDDA